MASEEGNKALSEDYAEILVEYNTSPFILERFRDYTIHIMNYRHAVVYIPVNEITENSILELGYRRIPKALGLVSRASLEASGISRIRNIPYSDLRGEGVTIAFIDTGINYRHPAFINEDGTSKISYLWDMTIDSDNGYPEPMGFGTVYTKNQINEALQSENPYDIVPSMDFNGHGTGMAGVAAGRIISEADFSGVAPNAELIIVKLKEAKKVLRDFFLIPVDRICYSSIDVMWGVQYVINTARSIGTPVSMCIGIGTSQGSHEGRDVLSRMLDIVGGYPGLTISVAAGNEGNGRRHYYREIPVTEEVALMELNIGENEPGFVLEIWGNPPNTYSIDIMSPSGEYIPRIQESLNLNREVRFALENTVINVDYLMVESQTGDQLILLRFKEPTEGVWRIQIYSRGDLNGRVYSWLPIEGFVSQDTYFLQSNPFTTITNPGNSTVPITVTAYNPENDVIYQNASRGYARDGTIKPIIGAPGVDLQAPAIDGGYRLMSGTGVATAHTAGITALILEWAILRENYPGMDTVEAKNFIIRGARRKDNLTYPNREWGYGMIDIYNVFDILRSNI